MMHMIRTCLLFIAILCNGVVFSQLRHSPESMFPTFHGRIMAGYQGWFRAAGDGSSAQRYAYGDENRSSMDMWPDLSEYTKTYPTSFTTADGKKAHFFSSLDNSTTDLHFKWMQQYGVDGVFMQRFFDVARRSNRSRDANTILQNAIQASVKYKRAIAVMYDLSGLKATGEDCSAIINDWKFLVDSLKVTSQPGTSTYLHHNQKPMVVIWGVGFPDRPYNIRNIGLERLIDFLKNDPQYGNCTVMLGVPTFWRSLNADCITDPYLHEIIKKADLIMPWSVQRFSPLLHNDMDRYRDVLLADMQWCRTNNVELVPCVYPGFSWHNLSAHEFPDDIKPVGSIPRQGGRFYWQLLSTAIRSGAKMVYVAMFDEINEGTAIFKVAPKPPKGKNVEFLGLEGEPSDHYLWLTGEATRMLRKEIPLQMTMPLRSKAR
jgi:hypothetical protein